MSTKNKKGKNKKADVAKEHVTINVPIENLVDIFSDWLDLYDEGPRGECVSIRAHNTELRAWIEETLHNIGAKRK